MRSATRRLRELTSAKVSSIERPVLAIPIGSCEQHGPHLPLGTDTIIAEALCDALASLNARIVVGPSLTMTSSGEHAGFPGTLSIGGPATSSTIIELVRSADWATGVVLVNGHGGNASPVSDAVAILRAESRVVTDWWPRIDGGDAHAGHIETSLMLHLAADLVDMDRAEVGNTQPLREIANSLRSGGLRAVSSNGILGDPRHASREVGEKLMADLVSQLNDHVALHHP